jgi:hypothetical protein
VTQHNPFDTAWLDVSGDLTPPSPVDAVAPQCALCQWPAARLFAINRLLPETGQKHNAVCTSCWLCFNLDTPSAALGALSWLPGMTPADVINLQRLAIIAYSAGNDAQRKRGRDVLKWLLRHKKEAEHYWKTVRPAEFALALSRQHPTERLALRRRLAGTHLVMSADAFTDLSLLLPAGQTAGELLDTVALPAL